MVNGEDGAKREALESPGSIRYLSQTQIGCVRMYSCQKYNYPRGSSPPRTGAGMRGIYAAWGPMALLPVLLATRSSFLCRLAFALVLVLVGGSGSRASGSGGVGVSEWEWEWKCKRAACWGWRPTLLQPLSRRRFTSEVGPGVWGVITRLPGLGR
jgi:hypothetical protein